MLKINNISNSGAYRNQQGPSFRGLTISRANKALNRIGAMQSPGQRLIFGAAALALHPIIDKMNPWVDEDTRNTSAIRSAAKAIACTLTGVIIREACILGTNSFLKSDCAKKLPAYMLKDKNHAAGVIGTLAGLGIMIFTNFLIDVPLTDKFTHMFTEMSGKKGTKNSDKPNTPGSEDDAVRPKAPAPAFSNNTQNNTQKQLNIINDKIKNGELPPMSQVNTEVLKCLS